MGTTRRWLLTVPRAEPMGDPERLDTVSYSYLDGVASRHPALHGHGHGLRGPRPSWSRWGGLVADELRSLGLPVTPDLATWGEGLSATFLLGEPV